MKIVGISHYVKKSENVFGKNTQIQAVKLKILIFSHRSRMEICSRSPHLTKKNVFDLYRHEKGVGHKLGFVEIKVRISVGFVMSFSHLLASCKKYGDKTGLFAASFQ